MFCDRILGNFTDAAFAGEPVDSLDLTWPQCRQRALRAVTQAGRTVRVLLPPASVLKHGDVLARLPPAGNGGVSVVAVNLLSCEVIVFRASSPAEAGLVCLLLGNLHAPVEVRGDEVITPPDGPAWAVFRRLGVNAELQVRRFDPVPVAAAPQFSADFRVVRG